MLPYIMSDNEDEYIIDINEEDETLLERLAQVERQRDDLEQRLRDSEETVRVLGEEQRKDKSRIRELEMQNEPPPVTCAIPAKVAPAGLIF